MTVQELYEKIGGSYETVKSQMLKDDLIHRFVLKFLNDKSYSYLADAVNSQNYEEAFKAAHTLKGVTLNLSFKKLSNSVCELTEFLRNKNNEQVDKPACDELMKLVTIDYNEVVNAINAYAFECQ